SRLQSVSPDLDLITALGPCHLPANRGWRLLPPTVPGAFRTKDVVITGDPRLQPIVAAECKIESFAEQFFPTILAVGSCGVSAGFGAVGIGRVQLVVLRVDTGRR